MPYQAPVADIVFSLKHAAGFAAARADGLYDLADEDIEAVLSEAGRFAAQVIAPLDRGGDRHGVTYADGHVTTAPGFRDAYRAWAAAGWNAVSAPEAWGGQGLPHAINAACLEMWNSASLAFGIAPVLTMAGVNALDKHGTDALKRMFMPKLVSGEWTGTMLLTEPQAGSDLAALRTKAERAGDGTYRLTGQKIFITYGEHDLTDNIVHFVLARLTDAPPGTKGISLFVVPKILVGEDGALASRNDIRATGIEDKLGLHASPACTMALGEEGGAVGYLVGEENRGLACMFTMMNEARLVVGLQGVATAEAATQLAFAYASERRQGRLDGMPAGASVAIVAHPDVQRMLVTMRSYTEAARAICYATAVAIDRSQRAGSAAARQAAFERASLLTPVAKAFSTDIGVEVASLGIQVHGGMGFIEETGAAQHYRDARIAPDLRRHQRHPGDRPRHPQAAFVRRPRGRGLHRPFARHRRLGVAREPPRLRAHGRASRRGGRELRPRHRVAAGARQPRAGRRARGCHALSAPVRPRRRRLHAGRRGAGGAARSVRRFRAGGGPGGRRALFRRQSGGAGERARTHGDGGGRIALSGRRQDVRHGRLMAIAARPLAGKTLFVTGASRGIGLAIALAAARAGANVAVAAKTERPHAKLPGTIHTAAAQIEQAGGRALPLVVDVRDEEKVAQAIDATVARFGSLDIVVNNASAIHLAPVEMTDMRRFDLMHQVNARGTFLVSKYAIPHLARADNPHILMISPPLDIQEKWFAPHTAYSLAKFGMSLVALGLSGELKSRGIAVNALWPRTTIATAAIEFLLGGAETMRRSRTPDIMADAVLRIFAKPARDFTGHFLIDDSFLFAEGVRDFDRYRVDPSQPLAPDFFVPDEAPPPGVEIGPAATATPT